MEKEYCIIYKEKRMFRWVYDYYILDAHKYKSAIEIFGRRMPNAIIIRTFVEYKKRS